MSDSVQPHRWQPTKLPRPWDFPGKNTGVGCHFLLQCMKVKSESEVAQSCPTVRDPMDFSLPGSPVHGIFQARVIYIYIYIIRPEKTLKAEVSSVKKWSKCHHPQSWHATSFSQSVPLASSGIPYDQFTEEEKPWPCWQMVLHIQLSSQSEQLQH